MLPVKNTEGKATTTDNEWTRDFDGFLKYGKKIGEYRSE